MTRLNSSTLISNLVEIMLSFIRTIYDFDSLKYRLVAVFVSINFILAGCAQPKPKPDIERESSNESYQAIQSETIPIPEKLPCAKQCEAEINRLKKQLKEKSDLIRNYQAQLKDQKLTPTEGASEVTQAQTRLHRLASQPSAASKIAEVEAETENLKQSLLINADQSDLLLFNHSQTLLNAATRVYEKHDYAASMNFATQSQAIIEMIKNSARKLTQPTIYSFKTPITVQIQKNSPIFVEPSTAATRLEKLQKDMTFTTNAYQANWLRIQMQSGQIGWIDSSYTKIYIPTSE